MTSRISANQAGWFRSWIDHHHHFPVEGFRRRTVLLHPGTALVDDARFPFASPSIYGPADPPLSPEQASAVDAILLEQAAPDTACSLALYAGYIYEDRASDARAIEGSEATWHRGRLNYLLFDTPLAEGTFASVEARWATRARSSSSAISGRTTAPGSWPRRPTLPSR